MQLLQTPWKCDVTHWTVWTFTCCSMNRFYCHSIYGLASIWLSITPYSYTIPYYNPWIRITRVSKKVNRCQMWHFTGCSITITINWQLRKLFVNIDKSYKMAGLNILQFPQKIFRQIINVVNIACLRCFTLMFSQVLLFARWIKTILQVSQCLVQPKSKI